MSRSQGGPGLEQRRETVPVQPESAGSTAQYLFQVQETTAKARVSVCPMARSLRTPIQDGWGVCVWRRDLKQVTSRQAASLLEQESRGGSLSRLLALPRVWVGLWVRVLGDRRPKGIGWHLAPEVR